MTRPPDCPASGTATRTIHVARPELVHSHRAYPRSRTDGRTCTPVAGCCRGRARSGHGASFTFIELLVVSPLSPSWLQCTAALAKAKAAALRSKLEHQKQIAWRFTCTQRLPTLVTHWGSTPSGFIQQTRGTVRPRARTAPPTPMHLAHRLAVRYVNKTPIYTGAPPTRPRPGGSSRLNLARLTSCRAPFWVTLGPAARQNSKNKLRLMKSTL